MSFVSLQVLRISMNQNFSIKVHEKGQQLCEPLACTANYVLDTLVVCPAFDLRAEVAAVDGQLEFVTIVAVVVPIHFGSKSAGVVGEVVGGRQSKRATSCLEHLHFTTDDITMRKRNVDLLLRLHGPRTVRNSCGVTPEPCPVVSLRSNSRVQTQIRVSPVSMTFGDRIVEVHVVTVVSFLTCGLNWQGQLRQHRECEHEVGCDVFDCFHSVFVYLAFVTQDSKPIKSCGCLIKRALLLAIRIGLFNVERVFCKLLGQLSLEHQGVK